MRFLMLNWRDPGSPLAGGAERVSLGYLSALAERGHEVYWFAHDFNGGASNERFGNVQVIRGGGVGTSVFRARQWMRQQLPFDLIIDQHHGIPWFAPWWSRTRTVAFIHEVLGPIWHSFYPLPLAWLGRLQERWMLRLYRAVPFWSACPSTEKALRKLGVRDVTLIPYGVSTQPIEPLPIKNIGSSLRLVVVSRLAPNKRIEHAIQALSILRDRGCDATLTIVGGGEMRGALEGLVGKQKLSRFVEFSGQLSESRKDTILAESHLLLHTSIREGWGLNVIEANCMGTPSVVYPVAGLIESTLDGVTGVVAQEETPEALVEGVMELVSNPELYQRCRRAAWERGAEFHWSKVLPQACDWLESLAAGASR